MNQRPEPDQILVDIADYVFGGEAGGKLAFETARLCLLDGLGCALAALDFATCTRLLGPVVDGTLVPDGARVPGTGFRLDPITAAFDLGAMIRWLDFNDTWLAAEWGHPSDNLGGILMAADWLAQRARTEGTAPPVMRAVLAALVMAYEIQGVLSLENSFNRAGLDHVLLVKVATAAVTAKLLGGSREQVINAVSNAWIDGQALRTYRHAPNTGTRKSWAAGDATSRGLRLAWMALQGEMGYPSAVTAKTWGFSDALFRGQPLRVSQPFGSYVMENILFKVSFPAEFHAQTAVEAAFQLHPLVAGRLAEVAAVEISTQQAALRIIDKTGPLHNPADRDHCLQYMTAVGLIFGDLTAQSYEDSFAADARIDAMRAKMTCQEDPRYSQEYLDPQKRSIANAVQVFFQDGTSTAKIEVEYPLGHRRRRTEAVTLLEQKFTRNTSGKLIPERIVEILDLFHDPERLDSMPVDAFVDFFV